MARSRDYNPQKERLLMAWLALASASKKLLKHAELMDRIEGNGTQFGAAIEFVYRPEDDQHAHPIGMIELATQAFAYVEGKGQKPEWMRHAGIED